MKRSDWQNLARLNQLGTHGLSTEEIYTACAALANNGVERDIETSLPEDFRSLLNARRLMKKGELQTASQLLLQKPHSIPLLEGDCLFRLANVSHRQGHQPQAAELHRQAMETFARGHLLHRQIRSLFNQLICITDYQQAVAGDLVSLEQMAHREGFHDLVAVSRRTRALELLRAARPRESLSESLRAMASYELDGCPEDRAIAVCIGAMAALLAGDLHEAQSLRSQVLITDGKVLPYLRAYEAVISGRTPKVSDGHPLQDIPWQQMTIKSQSVVGRLVNRLKEGPLGRDELIVELWGEKAVDPSYVNRLHAAVRSARKTLQIQIVFDGERYRLV